MRLEINGSRVFVGTGSTPIQSDRPTIVFLHGAGMDHSVWLMPARYFARHGFNVVAPDFPQHGQSQGDALESVEAMAEWVVTLLDSLELSKVACVGHSMGSLVALEMAGRWPERVAQLALLGTSAPMPVSDVLLDAAEANDHQAMQMANQWSHSSGGLLGGHAVPGMTLYRGALRLLHRTPKGVYHKDLSACNAYENGESATVNIIAPSLVLMGEEDKMTAPRASQKVVDRLNNAEVVRLPKAGHSMLSEAPNQVLNALSSFLLPAK